MRRGAPPIWLANGMGGMKGMASFGVLRHSYESSSDYDFGFDVGQCSLACLYANGLIYWVKKQIYAHYW